MSILCRTLCDKTESEYIFYKVLLREPVSKKKKNFCTNLTIAISFLQLHRILHSQIPVLWGHGFAGRCLRYTDVQFDLFDGNFFRTQKLWARMTHTVRRDK